MYIFKEKNVDLLSIIYSITSFIFINIYLFSSIKFSFVFSVLVNRYLTLKLYMVCFFLLIFPILYFRHLINNEFFFYFKLINLVPIIFIFTEILIFQFKYRINTDDRKLFRYKPFFLFSSFYCEGGKLNSSIYYTLWRKRNINLSSKMVHEIII